MEIDIANFRHFPEVVIDREEEDVDEKFITQLSHVTEEYELGGWKVSAISILMEAKEASKNQRVRCLLFPIQKLKVGGSADEIALC